MQLNEKQKQAVEYLDGPLLVLAGPGTGKTQLLSNKVAYILENTDTNAENILCLTFTDTGAKNMRERLKTMIGRDAAKVNIGTYHAFGQEILTQYKNYAENYDRRLDNAIDEVTQYKIVNAIQDSLPGTDILRGDNVRDIISVISEAKSANMNYNDLRKVAEQNLEDSKVLSEVIAPYLENIVPRVFKDSYERAYRPIYEILKDYENAAPIIPKVERSIVGLTRDLRDAIAEAESSQKIKPLSAWKDNYFEKDAVGNYRLKDRVANKKLLSLSNIMEKYDKYLRENGLFDFDDMIEEAVKALKTDDGFKLSLQERYQFIMLDEFQDTNPSQFEIVKLLTDYEKPLIMAVGDDDQAIYEFQGAMSSNLQDFQSHYEAEVIALVDNYRSTQEILDFAHDIIAQAPDRFGEKLLTSHKKPLGSTGIHRCEFNASDAEYGFIANKIAELIHSGVRQSEIAVISYKSKYFEPLLPYLKSHEEIKIAYEKRDNLFEDEKMHEIFTLCRYTYELAQEKRPSVSILEILAYPCFGLPMVEVLKAVGQARFGKKAVFDALAESECAAIKEVAEFLADLVKCALTEPLEFVLDKIVKKFGAEKLEPYERFRFYENLAALKGRLARHFGEKALKLNDLIEMLDDYEAAGMALTVTSPYKDADDAVQILTAHKAKGLEFEYVFIISADHTAWGKGKGNNNLLSLPKNMMQIRHTGTTDGEKLRILYVAMTRAKKCLYVTNSLYDFNGKSPERLEYFDEYVENDEVISPFVPGKKVELHYAMESLEKCGENLKNWLSSYVTLNPDMRAIYLERAQKLWMSASALTSFIDIVYAGPEAFFESYILQSPREPETEALAVGDLIHKTFEAVTNEALTDEQAIDFYLAELDKKDLEVAVRKKLREKGPADLAVALAEFRPVLENGKAEVNFAVDKLSIDGVPVTGKIDHIVIDEGSKTIEVYDFKTGPFHKEKWQSHSTLYKYMLQLIFYKMLLNLSPRFTKYRVEKAHILFVTPDNDGTVYDKEYLYNSDEEVEFRKLLVAVYGLISDLSFMDDPEVFVSPDENKKLADIKKFIELLLAKSSN